MTIVTGDLALLQKLDKNCLQRQICLIATVAYFYGKWSFQFYERGDKIKINFGL